MSTSLTESLSSNSDIYIPKFAITEYKPEEVPIRLGLQGAPSSGKTYAALTFPNPIVCDIDKKLRQYYGQFKFTALDFFDPDFCHKNFGAAPVNGRPNIKDALLKFLTTEAQKLTVKQTLIIDSWTMVSNNMQMFWDQFPPKTKTGEVDGFKVFRNIQTQSYLILEALKALKCNVVVTFHETRERDKEGNLTAEVRPLMPGQVGDQLAGHFTDFYRQICRKKTDSSGRPIQENGKDVMEYVWQIRNSTVCNCSCSLPWVSGQFIPANYQSILKT